MVRPAAIKTERQPYRSATLPDTPQSTVKRLLTPAAERALAEAAARRAGIDRRTAEAAREEGGRGGLDPNRYGDWEIKGLTADF